VAQPGSAPEWGSGGRAFESLRPDHRPKHEKPSRDVPRASKGHRDRLRFVVYDVSVLAGVDLRPLSWQDRRQRLELLAQALDVPLELSPLIQPSTALVHAMQDGRLEGIVLKDRTAPYRDGSRLGWHKVKDRSWYEREGWRFDRHG
jgi:ATP-dependent DNA ligase